MRGKVGMLEHVQVVDDRHPAQIEEILGLATVAGTLALPMADVRQGVLDLDPLAQLGSPQRRQLTLAQLRQELRVGMDRDAAALPLAAGTALAERAGGAGLGWKVNYSTDLERHRDLVGTRDRLLLPVESEGGLRELPAVTHRPGLAVDRSLGQPIPNERARQVGSIDVKLPEDDLLRLEVSLDLLGGPGIGHIGASASHRSDQAPVEVTEHVALEAGEALAPALAALTHRGVLDRDESVLGAPLAQRRLARGPHLDVLGLHPMGYRQARLPRLVDLGRGSNLRV